MAPVPQPGPDGCRNGKLRIIAEPLEEYVVRSVMARYLESPALAQALADQVTLPLTIRPTCDDWRR
jgi:hypothetical protein